MRNSYALSNGSRVLPDLTYQTRSLLFGATLHFDEVKAQAYLGNSNGNIAQVENYTRVVGEINAATSGIRFAGQALRVAGAAGLAYDVYSTGSQMQSQLATGNTLGAVRSGVQFGGRFAGSFGGAIAGTFLFPIPFVGTLAGGLAGAYGGNYVSGWLFDQAVGAPGGGSLIPPPAAPTGGESTSQGSAPIDTSQTWGSLQELDPMTGQPVGQPVNWGSTTAPAYQEMDGNGTKGGIGLTQQQSLSTTSEQLNYAAEPAQQTSGALGAINAAFGSGSGFAPADQLAPANAPVFDSGLYSALGNAVDTIGSAFNSAEIATAEAASGAAGVLDNFASTLGGFFGGGGGTPGFGGGGTPGFSGGGGFFFGGGGSPTGGPVVLDLSGKGIKITPLSSSNMYFDMANDGHQQHTAWAGAGNGVLVYDPSGGAVTQANQVEFTLWDPTATNDMQALRDVFDTNHDGVLNASDAGWSSFRILVTNADGTTTLETLAQAGVTSINLTPNAVSQTLPDGSSINGETTFTKTDGTTGTAAAVSFAYSGADYSVQQSVTHNADGSTTIDNKAYNPDGSLAQEIVTTTSADGLTKTTSFDWNGDGVVDQTQTDVTVVNADGSTTETLTDANGSGVLLDKTATTTSANGLIVTIARDTTGSGYTNQLEVRTTNADGSSSIAISDLTRNGTLIDKTVTSVSADGLTRTVTSDFNGDGVVDLTTVDQTVVAADGTRTETVTDTNADGSLRDQTVTVTSANGLSKTTSVDRTWRRRLRSRHGFEHRRERRRQHDDDADRLQRQWRRARPDGDDD